MDRRTYTKLMIFVHDVAICYNELMSDDIGYGLRMIKSNDLLIGSEEILGLIRNCPSQDIKTDEDYVYLCDTSAGLVDTMKGINAKTLSLKNEKTEGGQIITEAILKNCEEIDSIIKNA